jgi:hypothetical protein
MMCCQILAAAGTNLDLRGDQLARERFGEHRIGGGRVPQLLEASGESQLLDVEQRKLLLETDGQVSRLVEGRASGVELKVHDGDA